MGQPSYYSQIGCEIDAANDHEWMTFFVIIELSSNKFGKWIMRKGTSLENIVLRKVP